MIPLNDPLNNLKDRLIDENDALIERFSIINDQIEQLKSSDGNFDDDIDSLLSAIDSRIEDLLQHVSQLNDTLMNES